MKSERDNIKKLLRATKQFHKHRYIAPIAGLAFLACSAMNAWHAYIYIENPKLVESIGLYVFHISIRTCISFAFLFLGFFVIPLCVKNRRDEMLIYLAERELERDET